MGRTLTGAVGRNAEDRILRFLRDRGLKLVRRNFRTRRGEIDLVMLDEACLVFVEVRARGPRSFVTARLTVDARKQRKLTVAAMMFLARHPAYRHHACRFDVVGVDRDAAGNEAIDWVRDAFHLGA